MAMPFADRASTGVTGLDFILHGGLPRGKGYLLRGGPGSGKTTLALQFLRAGQQAGERTLFLTVSQSAPDLHLIAQSHGWSLTGIEIYELSPRSLLERLAARQTVLHPADVELEELVLTMQKVIQAHQPQRIVFDSIAALLSLAIERQGRYVEEIALLLALVQEQAATALFLDELTTQGSNIDFQALAHGTIELAHQRQPYGADLRWLSVVKLRGVDFLSGQHNYRIRTGGLEVFPRLQKPSAPPPTALPQLSSGIAALDGMLGGGLEMGTSCLIVGTAGTGKTVLATTYMYAALQRGDRVAVFLFEESLATFLVRCASLQMDLQPYLTSGQLSLQSVNTAELMPGEFSQQVRRVVEGGVRVLAIDSLTAYFLAMQEQELLAGQMHDLLDYLGQQGVLTLLIVALHGLPGVEPRSSIDISYLADTILLLRSYEVTGSVRRALTVVSKRAGAHEQSIRELLISPAGLAVGEPIDRYIGVLTGSPSVLVSQSTDAAVAAAGAGDGAA
jgi:circadian clock protein KaiC